MKSDVQYSSEKIQIPVFVDIIKWNENINYYTMPFTFDLYQVEITLCKITGLMPNTVTKKREPPLAISNKMFSKSPGFHLHVNYSETAVA